MLLLRVPRADARNVAVFVGEGARVVNLTEVAVLNCQPSRLRLLRRDVARIETILSRRANEPQTIPAAEPKTKKKK